MGCEMFTRTEILADGTALGRFATLIVLLIPSAVWQPAIGMVPPLLSSNVRPPTETLNLPAVSAYTNLVVVPFRASCFTEPVVCNWAFGVVVPIPTCACRAVGE